METHSKGTMKHKLGTRTSYPLSKAQMYLESRSSVPVILLLYIGVFLQTQYPFVSLCGAVSRSCDMLYSSWSTIPPGAPFQLERYSI